MKSESNKLAVRGELALIAMVIMNSAGVLLMLHSGSGISAISSVPYGFQQVFPQLTLGTWTYMFQGLLVLVLMLLRRKFMPSALLCTELPDPMLRHLAGQPLRPAHHPHRSVPP